MTLIEPDYISLVGANPILLGVQSANSDEDNFRIDVTVTSRVFQNGTFVLTELVTLSGTTTDEQDTVWFNLEPTIPFIPDRPTGISTRISQILNNNTSEFIITVKEFYGINFTTPVATQQLYKYMAYGNGRDVLAARQMSFKDIFEDNRFMSYQAQEKIITPNQVEYVNFSANRSTLYVKVYLSDGSSSNRTYAVSSSNLRVVLVNIGLSQLGLDASNTETQYVTHFEVSTIPIAAALSDLGTYYRYIIDYSERRWDTYTFAFVNSLGGRDTVTSKGKTTFSTKVSRQKRSHPELRGLSHQEHKYTNVSTSLDTMSVNFGWMNKEERLWMRDLAHSRKVWLIDYENNEFIPVNVTSSNLNLDKDDEPLQFVTMDFEFTEHEGL